MMGMLRVLALCLAAVCSLAQADDTTRKLRLPGSDYPIVLESLQIAIENQGLAIAARHEAAKVLARTAQDLGHRPDLFLDGEILAFCSVRLGAELAAEDPHNIVYCPMTVAVYRIPAEPDAVYLAWRPMPGDSAGNRAVNALLQRIIDETAESAGL
jgi:uncharacterized protein (DUF302 family)